MSTADAASLKRRYDEVSPKYEQAPNQVAIKLFWLAYEHLTWKPVEALLPKDGTSWRVLDAGGGGGKFGTRFAEAGHHVTVLDISPGMLDGARAQFTAKGLLDRVAFVEGNVAALELPDAAFDLVFCEGDPVSYCMDAYPQAVKELVRVAKPGAPVVLGVDNRHEAFSYYMKSGKHAEAFKLLQDGKTTCPYGLPVHAFTVRELEQAVADAGADLLEIFGKPVMFFDMLNAMAASRGASAAQPWDAWAAREEILAQQEKLAHEGFAVLGQHFQVMARRRA
ncbi:class I SAM-dependent methyltransferase [Corallococcus llansteffanensis]|uniref:Methyltransferase domain-containing protein n=1 Tax=Corallococcus llansteffanensis TaxID=2316731 RepID=A0A3A8PIT7_9BACT|nr:methyltransferase domain-containing protein [Corallococcus llansteffanensis]RKH53495.1 methyltransferase domain-containing protein [Corallococcus llansteffanensis]